MKTKNNPKAILRAAPRIVGQSIYIMDIASKDERIIWGLDNIPVGTCTYGCTRGGVTLIIKVEVVSRFDGEEMVSVGMTWGGTLNRIRFDMFMRTPGEVPRHIVKGQRNRKIPKSATTTGWKEPYLRRRAA